MDEQALPSFLTDTESVANVVAQATERAAEQAAMLDPAHWIARFELLSVAELRANWKEQLHAAGLPETTLDAVLRHVATRLSAGVTATRREYTQFVARRGQDQTHANYASMILTQLREQHGTIFADQGSFWLFDADERIFQEATMDALVVAASAMSGDRCKTLADYKAIANLAYMVCEGETRGVVEDAPIGFAAGDTFYKVEGGKIIDEPLTEKHFAKFKVKAKPSKQHHSPLLDGLLATSFGKDEAQTNLLKQHIGAALFQEVWRRQKALLWLGPGASGKSTIQKLVRAMFPRNLVSSVPPHSWEQEYHAAEMAGKVINLVGEIDSNKPLQSSFKNVTGNDHVQARQPTHRAFSYVSKASQIFNSNHLPPTEDRTNAFWRRWSIVAFKNVVPEQQRDITLAEKILEQELPALIALAIEGMQSLLDNEGRFAATDEEAKVFATWRRQTNSVEEFLHDDDYILLDSLAPLANGAGRETGRLELYETYKKWCADNRRHALGRNNFKRQVEEVGGCLGVEEKRGRDDVRIWKGVGLRF